MDELYESHSSTDLREADSGCAQDVIMTIISTCNLVIQETQLEAVPFFVLLNIGTSFDFKDF